MSENTASSHARYLKNLSIDAFNEMQSDFIESAAKTDNIMLLAPTGSGKTLAYLIPLVDSLQEDLKEVQALIIVPSRELAIQIEQVLKGMKTPFKVSTVYGGHAMKVEQNSLSEAPAVVIGTPGRLSDHVQKESFDTQGIKMIILDEFDKSLQMGFHEQLQVIFRGLKAQTQRHILTSATVLERLPDFIPFQKPYTVNYLEEVDDSKLELKLIHTSSKEKVQVLMRLVAGFQNEPCLVFCNHRDAVDRISMLLTGNGFEHGVLHGGMEQIDREKNLIKFRSGVYNLLIATDLASRGLDIPEIMHVVHYQLPIRKDAFIHRNGRTARMHAEGNSYLVLANDEVLPDYIDKSVEEITVTEELQPVQPSSFECLYFSAGKKDKISKGDIVGLLTQKGGLTTSDIGLITVLDFSSYVAVKRSKVAKTLDKIRNEKLKKSKVKIEVAR
ncbi:DEAD/DEAH box helicase [Cognataquiflexum aquatile]|uniref:DEAD/DEAH box helicase n=1 Tax=Cognataquiflexum aquatile TaxID=2249427 RepID=UPI000DEB4488|nr:DEAD/DEAH box helicase [Cognataquiflexum aquatile]